MISFEEITPEIRQKNLERKKQRCLMCNRIFTTTRINRTCGKCHKLIDNRFYD